MLWTDCTGFGLDVRAVDDVPRLTLVVLRAAAGIDGAEAAFYREAELYALAHGAAAGLVVLAFAGAGRDELILFSAEPVERVGQFVAALPFVAAGLARPEISEVRVLRLPKAVA